jgi:hypothetical protein
MKYNIDKLRESYKSYRKERRRINTRRQMQRFTVPPKFEELREGRLVTLKVGRVARKKYSRYGFDYKGELI